MITAMGTVKIDNVEISASGFEFRGTGEPLEAQRAILAWVEARVQETKNFWNESQPYVEFKQRVLGAVQDDIVLDTEWVFWMNCTTQRGFLNAASLRVIADELDKRNKELFSDAV